MKRITNATLERLRTISPSQLVNKGIIKTAPNFNASKQSGYGCPLCGSGTHDSRNSDGAGFFDANNRFFCHACKNADVGGHKISTIDLFARARNLQHESFSEVCRKMCAEFGEELEEEDCENRNSRKRRRNKTPPPPPPKPIDTAEIELIRADLQTSSEPLKKFVEGQGGGFWRGLPAELLIRFGCRYIAAWTPPKSRVEKKFATPTQRILIPSGTDFYLARFCGNLDDFDEQTRKYVTPKLNAGSPKLFHSDALNSDEPIFAVEGAIDAISVEFVGYRAVALNSVSNGNLLVAAVAKMEKKPRVILLLDSDEQGRKNAPKLQDALLDVGCPAVIRFLFDDTTKTDANDILVAEGVENLRGRLESIVDSALAELDAVSVELEGRSDSEVDDALIDFLFSGDKSDLDFAKRLEKFCGDEIRWLTDDRAWLLYKRNEFGGGLWTNAGEKNSCLFPHAKKMAELMLEHPENSDEKKLANQFKMTRKISQSITLLKGFENLLVTSEDLDNYSELLNVRNGVIDLTSGKLLPAAPELLLSQQAAAAFDPKCTDSTFVDFFKSVLPDDDTRAAVQRFLGYCLTADVSAEKFLLIHGRGGNGKGVALLTLRTLLKDFAVELPVDTVLENRGRLTADANGRATTELTPLVNRRVGIVDELPRGGRFDTAKVNRLTGGDYLPIRKLHHEFFDVPPTHKLILTGNFRPQIDDPRDAALLRRLIAVNFTQDFSQNPDVTLKKKLLADSALTGALNFLVAAAVDFYRDGLLEPSTLMKQAREEFLGENDFLGDYLAEYYERGTGEDFTVKRKELLAHLRLTCHESSRFRDSDLVTMITKIDGITYTKDRTKNNVFRGIRRKEKKKEPQQGGSDGFEGEIISSADCPPF